jgi:hypothetical protein
MSEQEAPAETVANDEMQPEEDMQMEEAAPLVIAAAVSEKKSSKHDTTVDSKYN